MIAKLCLAILSAYLLLFRIPWIIARKKAAKLKEINVSEQYELPRVAKRVPTFLRPLLKDFALWLTITFYVLAAYEILKREPLSEIVSFVGLLLWTSGVLISMWATYELGKHWSAAPEVLKDHVLVTSGPYRISRHPIYVGNGLQQVGAVFVTQSVILLIALLAVFVPVLESEGRGNIVRETFGNG